MASNGTGLDVLAEVSRRVGLVHGLATEVDDGSDFPTVKTCHERGREQVPHERVPVLDDAFDPVPNGFAADRVALRWGGLDDAVGREALGALFDRAPIERMDVVTEGLLHASDSGCIDSFRGDSFLALYGRS